MPIESFGLLVMTKSFMNQTMVSFYPIKVLVPYYTLYYTQTLTTLVGLPLNNFLGNEASLRVTNSLDDDSGLYTIICENDQGESRAQCNVIVRN